MIKRTKHSTRLDTLGRKASPGAKGAFKQEYLQQAELLSKLGATLQQIALFFNKHPDTITKWIKKKPEFREAIKRGGIVADMKAVDSLFKRVTGFTYEEIEVNESFMKTPDGKKTDTKVVNTKRTLKYVIPDVKAIQYWLGNRQREAWTNVNRLEASINHTGQVNHVHEYEKIDIEKLTPAAQELVFEVAMNQLELGKRDN